MGSGHWQGKCFFHTDRAPHAALVRDCLRDAACVNVRTTVSLSADLSEDVGVYGRTSGRLMRSTFDVSTLGHNGTGLS